LKHQLKTDIRGVNVWPYASVMLDESRSRSIIHIRRAVKTRKGSIHIFQNISILTTKKSTESESNVTSGILNQRLTQKISFPK